MATDSNLSPTTLVVGSTLVLVAGVIIHQNKDRLSSLLVEDFSSEEMRRNTDWQKLSIPAQVTRCFSNVNHRSLSGWQRFCRGNDTLSFSSYLNNTIRHLRCILKTDENSLEHLKNLQGYLSIFFVPFLSKYAYYGWLKMIVLGSRMSWSTCCCITWLTTIVHNRQIRDWWSGFYNLLRRFSSRHRSCSSRRFVQIHPMLFFENNMFFIL